MSEEQHDSVEMWLISEKEETLAKIAKLEQSVQELTETVALILKQLQ
jgi:hypothetical protein